MSSLLFIFFFFKQKTAYEMRISDWSSDVCSSDLLDIGGIMHRLYPVTLHRPGFMKREGPARRRQRFHHQPVFVEGEAAAGRGWRDIAGMVNDLEHAWLAVDRQAIEAARRSGRAKRQRRRPADRKSTRLNSSH